MIPSRFPRRGGTSGAEAAVPDPFAPIHAAERRRTLRSALAVALVAGLVGAGWVASASADAMRQPPSVTAEEHALPVALPAAPVPGQQPGGSDETTGPPGPGGAGSGAGGGAGGGSGGSPSTDAVQAPGGSPPPATPVAQPTPVRIDIRASGYQAEIDRCLWVRMELGAHVPIVGAHLECGGDVVLAMRTGDRVVLTGEGLDGEYAVAEDRTARPGDDAKVATAGMAAGVILQTCFPSGGDVRLVALLPVVPATSDASPPVASFSLALPPRRAA